jgi:glycosyltransferase involved in cell wall biosynthesis
MLAYTFYEGDNRVRRYAETFSSRGDTVDAIVLRQHGAEKKSQLNGVKIRKIQKRNANEKGKIEYLIKLLTFFINSFFLLTLNNLKKKYDIIHVHSVPDFLVFATLFAKINGSKIILDIHDIVPELFASKFKVNQDSIQFKILLLVEKLSTNFADHVIVANHLWHNRLIDRAVSAKKCTVVLNYPDPKIFNINNDSHKIKRNDFLTIVYPGTLSRHQGLETALRALEILKKKNFKIKFKIYGKGTDERYLCNLTKDLDLLDVVTFNEIVPIHKLPEILMEADLGIEPKSSKTFANEALSTKIFEFMIMGIPVIAADTLAHKHYFNESIIMFFESDNYYKLADCIEQLWKSNHLREELIINSKKFISDNNWQIKQKIYLDIIDDLKSSDKL